MGANNRIKPLYGLITLLIYFVLTGAVFAYNNPELLPENATPVIDLARTLSDQQKVRQPINFLTLRIVLYKVIAKIGFYMRSNKIHELGPNSYS